MFVDDGYSGVSFDRPGFQETYKLIESGKVGIVITKDLSRLGRNYIEVGNYTEFIFPRYGVRYIAINDNYDSLFSDNNELAPFKNLFNEWYARDTSKKIRSVFKAKAERGERLSTQIPYGYRRDPNSGKECHLLINEETAPVVKMIFSMCAEGIGPSNISKALEERKILKPTMYRFMHEGKYGTHTDTENPYKWNERTIADILDNEIYLGHTINCRTRISKEPAWDADRIYQRGIRLLRFMESRWGFRFESTEQMDELLHIGFIKDGREIPEELSEENMAAAIAAPESKSESRTEHLASLILNFAVFKDASGEIHVAANKCSRSLFDMISSGITLNFLMKLSVFRVSHFQIA